MFKLVNSLVYICNLENEQILAILFQNVIHNLFNFNAIDSGESGNSLTIVIHSD